MSQQDVSLSNVLTIENVLKQCSRFKQKKRKKNGSSRGSEEEDEGVLVFLSKFKTTLTILVFRTWPNFDV